MRVPIRLVESQFTDNGCGQRPGGRQDDYIRYISNQRDCWECDFRPLGITSQTDIRKLKGTCPLREACIALKNNRFVLGKWELIDHRKLFNR